LVLRHVDGAKEPVFGNEGEHIPESNEEETEEREGRTTQRQKKARDNGSCELCKEVDLLEVTIDVGELAWSYDGWQPAMTTRAKEAMAAAFVQRPVRATFCASKCSAPAATVTETV
jgi:hypothetical protein